MNIMGSSKKATAMNSERRRFRANAQSPSLTPSVIIARLTLLVGLVAIARAQRSGCPSADDIPLCPCYDDAEGVSLECPEVDLTTLEAVLVRVRDPIVTLSVYDPQGNVTVFPRGIFQRSAPIKALKFTQCAVSEFQPGAFKGLEKSLESLTIINSELTELPLDAVKPLGKLESLVVESSHIGSEIASYSFHGLPLKTLSLANNEVQRIADDAFAGCEETLTSLDLSGNRLKSFPGVALKRLTRIETLKLKGNQISRLTYDGFTDLPKLESLDLSANRLENLTDTSLQISSSLKTISLYFNEISSLPANIFSHLDQLKSVALGYNRLSNLDPDVFKGRTELRRIDLNHNNLHRLPAGLFKNLPNLEEVVLAHNQIGSIGADTFKGSSALTTLHLQNNEISKIHVKAFASLTNLAQLHLSGNKLKRLPPRVFESQEALKTLNLGENNLKAVETEVFLPLTNLAELRLHDNEITSIPSDAFSSLVRVMQLHLQNNRIEAIANGAFSRMSNLRMLNLDGNKLTKLGPILDPSGASLLTTFTLAGNDIEEIHPETFTRQNRLKTLKLSDNRLQRIGKDAFGPLVGLKKLLLDNNVIRVIEDDSFALMQGLALLDLNRNHITELRAGMFRGLASLTDLNLESNEISQVHSKAFEPLGKLRALSLKGNPLAVLEPHIFKFGGGLNSPLRKLDLENCRITRISSEDVFGSLSRLEELNLASNELTILQGQLLKIPSLRSLKISRNPIKNAPDLLSSLPNLRNLEMDQVPLLSEIPRDFFKKGSLLQRLSLAGNSLPSLTLEHLRFLENLTQLIAENSSLLATNFFRSEATLSTLEHIDLSGNDFPELKRSMVAMIKNARFLDLRGCGIMKVEARAFDDAANLRALVLSNNRLDFLSPSTLTGSPHLESLDLSGNLFAALPFAARKSSLKALKTLNLAGNPLVNIRGPDEFHLSGSGAVISTEEMVALMESNIVELDLSRGKLTYVSTHDFEGFDTLAALNLRENAISEISEGAFESLGSLTTLDVSFNELTRLDGERFRGLVALKTLNLTRNYLESLSGFTQHVRNLKVLDASFNRIATLNPEVFQQVEGLETLIIRGNLINIVNSKAFLPLKSLTYLDLSDNRVEKLSPRAFRPVEDKLKILLLTGNPFSCDCSMESFYSWLVDHDSILTRSNKNEAKLLDGSSGSSAPGGTSLAYGGAAGRDRRSSTADREIPTCNSPSEMKGTPLTDGRLVETCSTPLITDLVVEGVEPTAILVSWDSPAFLSQPPVGGFKLMYQAVGEGSEEDSVVFRDLDSRFNSYKMDNLSSDTRYHVCVVALEQPSATSSEVFQPGADVVDGRQDLDPSSMPSSARDRRCAEARTLPRSGAASYPSSSSPSDPTAVDGGGGGDGEGETREAGVGGATLWIWLAVAAATVLVLAVLVLVAVLIARRKRRRRRGRTPQRRRQGSATSASMMGSSLGNGSGNGYNTAKRNGATGSFPTAMTAVGSNGGNGAVDYSAYRHFTMRSDGAFESAYIPATHNNGVHNGGY